LKTWVLFFGYENVRPVNSTANFQICGLIVLNGFLLCIWRLSSLCEEGVPAVRDTVMTLLGTNISSDG